MKKKAPKRKNYLCRDCAEEGIKDWKGAPREGEHPLLPLMEDGICPVCDGHNRVHRSRILYLNVHGPGSTGLPDYFTLTIYPNKDDDTYKRLRSYGLPYVSNKYVFNV